MLNTKFINILITSTLFLGSFTPTLVHADASNVEQKVPLIENKQEENVFTLTNGKRSSVEVKKVLKTHQNLMLYGSNSPGKETYDLRKTTDVVKSGEIYKKWVNSSDYKAFHTAWSKLSATEKALPEIKKVYREYQSAKTYLKATDAIFNFYNEVKKNAKSISLTGEKIDALLNSNAGLRKNALTHYQNYCNTSHEKKIVKSRREYINKKYLATIYFLEGSKSLQKARTTIQTASNVEAVDKIMKSTTETANQYVSMIGSYSTTFVKNIQWSLAQVKNTATARKKDFSYAIGNVDNNGKLVLANDNYATFNSANKNLGNNEVIVRQDKLKGTKKVIKATNGIVSVASTTASIYASSNLTNPVTYNAKGTELQYLGTVNENVVKVRIADTVGFMKMNESTIIPNDMVTGFSYYVNKNGTLYHHIYNQATKSYIGEYPIGEEVGSLKENVKYYSLNGVDFYLENGKKAATLSKQKLYQFMDASTSNTKYTAKHMDDYLKAVKPSSPIIGEGKNFIDAGKKYGVNPILLFALANHESNYGTNELSILKKNIFSINAIDSDPLGAATTYKSYKESIFRAAQFLKEKYMNKNDWRFEGNYFGNKSEGFNVQYASDPFWGQKVAGHYYRFVEWVQSNDKK